MAALSVLDLVMACTVAGDRDTVGQGLRESALDYSILGPGLLTLESATGKIVLTEDAGNDWPDDKRVTSRENVAEVIAHVIRNPVTIRQTVNFYDGDEAIADEVKGL